MTDRRRLLSRRRFLIQTRKERLLRFFSGDIVMANKKILVVDDEIHIIHVVAIKLRNNGYEVVAAENGLEGYETACREKPDLVVTDYQMPMMSGLEMVEKLRQNPDTADIPVIMLTARSFAIENDQKQQLQIAHFLSKPFSPKELLMSIEDILYQRQVAANGSQSRRAY